MCGWWLWRCCFERVCAAQTFGHGLDGGGPGRDTVSEWFSSSPTDLQTSKPVFVLDIPRVPWLQENSPRGSHIRHSPITSFLDMEWLTPIGDGYICSYGLVWWMTWRLTERVEETTYKTQNTELLELKNANYLKLYLLSPFMKTCFLRKGPKKKKKEKGQIFPVLYFTTDVTQL